MNNARKRISALVLALCLVLSMAVPAVWADPATTYTYDFDYTGITGAAYLTTVKDTIAAEYDTQGSQQNWKFREQSNIVEGASNDAYYRAHASFVSESGIALKYLRVYTNEGGYIAFTVKTPTTGVYQVDWTYARSSYAASTSEIYILDKDTTDIAAAIVAAEGNGTFDPVTVGGTVGSTDPATKVATWLDPRDTASNPCMRMSTVGTWTADGDAEHILVFKATTKAANQPNAYLYPTELTLTYMGAGPVAEVNSVTYDSVEAAVGAATSGQTVKLLTDAEASNAVVLGEGVTLDLNGNKLTAPSVNAITPNAKVKDGSNGQGLLAVSQNTENATYLNVQKNNGQLPLYDAAEGAEGYRFFDFTLQSIDDVEKDANTRRFWFKLTLNEKAYELIATGNSGLIVKTGWTWKGEAINGVDNFVFQAATVTGWASAMAEADNYGFYLDVTGFDSVNEDGILAVTPKIESAGIEISAASAIEYAHNAA